MHRFLVPAAVLLLAAAPLHAQQQPGYKDPGTAQILSVIVPGGGQLYSEDTQRGLVILGIGVGSMLVGEAAAVGSCSTGSSCGTGTSIFLAGIAVGVGAWVYGIVDAPHSAEQHNASLGKRTASLAPIVLPDEKAGKDRLGLALKIRF